MNIDFRGPIYYWRGPAPWYFVAVPPAECREIKALAASVTYGWGMIPGHRAHRRGGVENRPVAQG